MNPSKQVLDQKLAELESLLCKEDHEIWAEITNLRDRNSDIPPCQEWIYEATAFGFREDYPNKETGWGTYYGPMMVFKADDGNIIENPCIKQVDKETIAYW